MAFTKIQPQQLQLPTFTSPSGDFSFTDLSTGFQINLERDIDGPIDFNGSATIDDDPIITTASTNSIADTCFVLGGSDNEVTGTSNVIVNGSSNTDVSGDFNTLLNGTLVDFGASGQRNTILAGKAATFADQTTGAVILAGHEGSATNSTNHSLLVSFNSGVTFQQGDVNFNSNLRVDSNHTGIFGGDLDVTGAASILGDSLFGGLIRVFGNITGDNSITSVGAGGINATVGDITATDGNIVATAGNITAEVGNIVATDGNIVATDGNVFAPNILASEDLGYSSGGTVTQATTITSAVTLNAASGVITCYVDPTTLLATYPIGRTKFVFNNSAIGDNDVVLVSLSGSDGSFDFSVEVADTYTGSCVICITNHYEGLLGPEPRDAAVIINFAVIKVATS